MNWKINLLGWAIIVLACPTWMCAQSQQGITHSGQLTGQTPFPLTSYIELKNPTPTDLDSWRGIRAPRCAWGNIYERYSKESNPNLRQKHIRLKGWKGERVAAQLVIMSPVQLDNVQVEMSLLKDSRKNNAIAKSQIMKGFVRYVMTDELNKTGVGSCGPRPDLSLFDSTLVADPIDHINASLPVKANTTQGYWIRVWIPQDAEAGIYASEVVIKMVLMSWESYS